MTTTGEESFVVVLGERGAGKTSLVRAICGLPAEVAYSPSKVLLFSSLMRNSGLEKKVKLADIGGYMEDADLTYDYIDRADVILVVWQAQCDTSFEFALSIIKDVQLHKYNCPFILVETKCDLERSSFLIRQDVAGIKLINTSASHGIGIRQTQNEIFYSLFTGSEIAKVRKMRSQQNATTSIELVEILECEADVTRDKSVNMVRPEFMTPDNSLMKRFKNGFITAFSRMRKAVL